MIDIDIISALSGIFAFMLLLVFLFGAIEMLTNLWTDKLPCPKIVSQTAGWAMVVGAADCAYWIMMVIEGQAHNEPLVKLGESLDVLIYLSVFMIGEAILFPKTFSWKKIILYFAVPTILAILNPIICNNVFELTFIALGLIQVIVMIVRHFRAKPEHWFRYIIIMVIIVMLNYLTISILVATHIENVHTTMFLYTISNLLTTIVWITIIRRLHHLDNADNSERNSGLN